MTVTADMSATRYTEPQLYSVQERGGDVTTH